MSAEHSTSQPVRSKPAKPYPTFPLTAHPAGTWCKKIRGKLHYFGPWHDPDAALAKYLEQKDSLHAGRKPREAMEGATVHDLVNRFLNQKQAKVDSGELSPRTWTDYKEACVEIVTNFGKHRLLEDLRPDDFTELRVKMAKQWGMYRLGKMVQCVRSVFKFATDQELVERTIRFGQEFKRPTKQAFRKHRAKQGAKMFTADEIRLLLGASGPTMKAMLLLAANCGFGNSDCGNLTLAAIDFETGWVNFPRPKTGVPRRCPLWPETLQAIKDSLAKRNEPKSEADAALVFVTRYGGSWAKDVADSPITKEMRKLLGAVGINGHRNFYCLRHGFRTVADECKDQPAANLIMGHEPDDMSTRYREGVSNARLQAVSDYVRAWLFAPAKLNAETAEKPNQRADEE
jgi:integrase